MAPKRCCIACRNIKDKIEFFRIVSVDNNALYDMKQKVNARGIYVCKNKDCIENLINKLNKKKVNLKILVDNQSLLNVLEYLKCEVEEKNSGKNEGK